MNRRIALTEKSDLFHLFYATRQQCWLYFLADFDAFALAAFLAAGLAELPQGLLAAQPPFCAMVFTSFHNSFRLFVGTPSQKQTRDVIKRAMVIVG